jgi:hypothetical protein
LFSYPKTNNRHFDRSCSQHQREQRSGEIRFSYHSRSATHAAHLPLLSLLGLAQGYKALRKIALEESGLQPRAVATKPPSSE